MPTEIIPKPPVKVPLWLNIILYFSIALLLVTLSSYFVLKHFRKEISRTIQKIDTDLSIAKAPQQALEKALESQKKKIDAFSVLFSSHELNSKIFPFLEKRTHPKVFFSSFALNSSTLDLILSGETESFQTLGQQIFILKAANEIKSVNLSEVSIGREGAIIFTLNLSLDPIIFK